MPEPIKQEVVVVGDAAIAKLKEIAEANATMAKSTDAAGQQAKDASAQHGQAAGKIGESGDAAKKTADAHDKLGDAAEKVGRKVKSPGDSGEESAGFFTKLQKSVAEIVLGFFAFEYIAGKIVDVIKEIRDAAIEATHALNDMAKANRGLTVNLGPKEAKAVREAVEKTAKDSGFDSSGEAQLTQAATELTNISPGIQTPQLIDQMKILARAQRASSIGFGGAEQARLVDDIQKNLKVSFEQAAEIATTMINRGYQPDALKNAVERTGPAGGKDFLALNLAAAQEGLDPNSAGKVMQSIAEKMLHRTNGRPDVDLMRLGVKKEMDLNTVIRTVVEKYQNGEINRDRFIEAIGGEQNLRAFEAYGRVFAKGELPAAEKAIDNPHAIDEAIVRISSDPDALAGEEENRLHLQKQLDTEERGRSPKGLRALREENQNLRVGNGDAWWGWIKRQLAPVGGLMPRDEVQRQNEVEKQIEDLRSAPTTQPSGDAGAMDPMQADSGPVSINNVNHVTIMHQYNAPSPWTMDAGRTEQD